MAKRLSDKQKEELTQEFINGKNINDLAEEFSFTKLTISKNLKKSLGDSEYKESFNISKSLEEKSIKNH